MLPLAKTLVITALRQLSTDYGFQQSRFKVRINQANELTSVKRVRPDMESRDNASVYLSRRT